MTKLDGARFIAVMALACWGSMDLALADSLGDPTRPAPEWLATQASAPGAVATAKDSGLGLRVLVIGPTRKFAIIDGQTVRLGETFNGAKLVGFHADGVVMQKDGSKERLSMSPAVGKKVLVSNPVAGKTKSKKNVLNGEGQ